MRWTCLLSQPGLRGRLGAALCLTVADVTGHRRIGPNALRPEMLVSRPGSLAYVEDYRAAPGFGGGEPMQASLASDKDHYSIGCRPDTKAS